MYSPGASISDFLLDLVDEDTVLVPGYRGSRGMTALVSVCGVVNRVWSVCVCVCVFAGCV
jgi:hypothetical protein